MLCRSGNSQSTNVPGNHVHLPCLRLLTHQHPPHKPQTDSTATSSSSSSKNRRDDGPGNVVIVVLLCWGTHHVLAAVKKEYCRRVTPEELEAMLALWMVRMYLCVCVRKRKRVCLCVCACF